MPTILFFGDSLCAGSDVPDRGEPWPVQWARDHGAAWTMLNRSRGGRPTASRDEFTAALAGVPAGTLLVLALGTNDSRSLEPGMVAEAVANLRWMLAAATAVGIAEAILVAPPDINPDALGPTRPIRVERAANLAALEAAYRELAAELGLGFVAFHGVLPMDSLRADGVHPDHAGNRLLAERFAAYLAAARDGSLPAPKT